MQCYRTAKILLVSLLLALSVIKTELRKSSIFLRKTESENVCLCGVCVCVCVWCVCGVCVCRGGGGCISSLKHTSAEQGFC